MDWHHQIHALSAVHMTSRSQRTSATWIGLVLFSASLIASVLPAGEAACKVKNVVVVGAGISGAAAAKALLSIRPKCFKVRSALNDDNTGSLQDALTLPPTAHCRRGIPSHCNPRALIAMNKETRTVQPSPQTRYRPEGSLKHGWTLTENTCSSAHN